MTAWSRRPTCWVLPLLGGLAAAAQAAAPERASTIPDGLQLVRAYNARNFGSPGWRRVSLELKSGDEVTRRFTVVNLWRKDDGVVRTLFVLEAPQGLRGTNYLLVEDPARPAGMDVFLHLPAGRRGVLIIEPSRFDEGLLGSDFGYRDLRMQIPVRGFQFERTGETVIRDTPVWVVSAQPVTPETRRTTSWARVILYFAKQSPLLVGIDLYSADNPNQQRKTLRVLGWRQIEGVWTETMMVMIGQDGRTSTLTLEDASFGVPNLGRPLFTPEALPSLSEQLDVHRAATGR